MNEALDALRRVNFDWVRTLDSVWLDTEPTGGPNEALIPGIVDALHAPGARPPGRVLVGDPGIGKTHLVGQIRREVWASGGWFVLLDVLGLTDFWRSAALSYLTAMMHPMPDGRRQSDAVLAGVARRFRVEEQVEQAFNTPNIDTRRIVDLLVRALMHVDTGRALQHQDVFRALCLLRSQDLAAVGLAHAWLQGYEADPAARTALGFTTPPPAPIDLVRGMAWIMGLSGPTLVAVDQIDGIVDSARLTLDDDFDTETGPSLAEVLVAGLMQLHDGGGRGMTLVTCLSDSWRRLEERGLKSAFDRFEAPVFLKGLNMPAAAAALIRNRLAPAYAEAGFTPLFPTWPFSETAIAAASRAAMRPRTLLMRCDAFRRDCLANETVSICDDINEPGAKPPPAAFEPPFDLPRAILSADISGILDDEEAGLGELLRAVFDLYALEDDPHDEVDVVSKGEPEQRLPPLHGRLTFLHRDENDRERHVCYRALLQAHPIAFQARLRAALTASGISTKIPGRELLLVRRGPVPDGAKTSTLVDRFLAAGGKLIDPSDDDLRTFVALRNLRAGAMRDGEMDQFERWMRDTLPVRGTAFFRRIGLPGDGAAVEPRRPPRGRTPLPPLPPRQPRTEADQAFARGEDARHENAASPSSRNGPEPRAAAIRAATIRPAETRPVEPSPVADPIVRAPALGSRSSVPPVLAPDPGAGRRTAPPPPTSTPDAIPVGHRLTPDAPPVALPLRLLPRHTAIIAGSGSGKTVLLRRLVEEAALAGIPAIVVDPNNDLSRLGDAWPERPERFTPEDDRKAAAYAERVEVVVWTPGLHAGNPLFLSVMPDLVSHAAGSDDRDERAQAIEMATETIGPLAGATKTLQRGVLADALRAFAARGGGTLGAFTDLLADLPDGTSQIGKAQGLAATMADQLLAAVATNPLLRVEGAVLDPARLFHGPDPARTRISVVNLSGLASEAAREDFVNRLQMALFGWIKRHPAPRGLLYVVDEAQTFLPSGRTPPSLGSGIKLVAQGRKYGLGMIVATQVPKGIHNQIVSNCTTQFFGRQSAPATIAAAQEIMAASGGAAPDLGRLGAGEFYFSTEGSGKPAKLRTPLCLSHHPANPPTPEEVAARARASAAADGG